MTDMQAMWLGLGAAMIIPFAILGAALRPFWLPLAFADLGSLIWIPGLGVSAWIAGAVGSLIGCFIGIPIRRGLLAFRARRIANRTQVSPGGPS
jgi:hypothetical protein